MKSQHIRSLLKSTLFEDITVDDLSTMLGCLCPRVGTFARHEMIASAGQPFGSLGIVLSGEALVYRNNAAGDRVLLTILKAGDMFGEMIAFARHLRWPVNVEASEACEVFFLSRDRIIGQCSLICPWHKKLIINMLAIVSEKALSLNKQVEYCSIKSIRGKLAAFLLDQHDVHGPAFTLSMNRNELADYLNVSRPSLSRELGRMRDEGIIDFHLRKCRILSLKALQECLL